MKTRLKEKKSGDMRSRKRRRKRKGVFDEDKTEREETR